MPHTLWRFATLSGLPVWHTPFAALGIPPKAACARGERSGPPTLPAPFGRDPHMFTIRRRLLAVTALAILAIAMVVPASA
ncbi:MAG: hypothetical protein ACSLFM_13540, partial [Tepidiformaceae bacterium]